MRKLQRLLALMLATVLLVTAVPADMTLNVVAASSEAPGSEPTTPETESTPTTPGTESTPTTPETESTPTTPGAGSEPTTPGTESTPTTPGAESTPTTPGTETTPTTPGTETTPTTPGTESTPTTPDTEVKYTRIEAEDAKYVTSKTFKDGEYGETDTPYLQFTVEAKAAGTYTLSIGAYVEVDKTEEATTPNGTILVNDKAYQAEFSDSENGCYEAELSVELKEGDNLIQCIGVTKDQTDAGVKGWIGYDYFEIPEGLTIKTVAVKAVKATRAGSNAQTSITVDAATDTNKYHRSTNTPDTAKSGGVYAYTSDNGLSAKNGDIKYDIENANRKAKVCIYNLRKLMTEKIGTSSDKGIGRYPYVVTKINVTEAGYYDIGTEINMNANPLADTMIILVDGIMHIVKPTKGSTAHQEVWKNNLYLSVGEHSILYMSAMPQNESDCPSEWNTNYYPWTNFWKFMVRKTSGEAINNSVEYLDVSSLTGENVENIFKESTRIEAEDKKYVNWNIYSKTDGNASASGSTVVGGPAYNQCQQSFDDLTNNGLDKAKTPYLQYMVEAPTAGTYYITIGANVGTGTNNSNPVPYVAVVVNDNAPVKAQFDGAWNKLDSVTVPVQLEKGVNTIRCTSVTPDQYSAGTAWVNHDYIELQKGLTAIPVVVSAEDSDWDNYLYLNRYTDSGVNFGDPNYTDMRYDFPSLYEDMYGIYSGLEPDRAGRWPYIAFKVYASQAGEYQIVAETDGIGNRTDKTVGMIVDGAMYIIEIPSSGTALSKTVYLSQGSHVIVFTSPIPRDLTSRPESRVDSYYPWMNFKSFNLDGGLSFEAAPIVADIQSAMTNYTRIEAEDFSYVSVNGSYNADISKTYKIRKADNAIVDDTVQIKGAAGAAIDGNVTEAEKSVNAADSYIHYVVKADKAGKYVLRIGAYVEGSGNNPYGTILVNGTAYKAQFTGWNRYEAVNIPVELTVGENTIKCIGVTADQTGVNGWIGYDFIDVPNGVEKAAIIKTLQASDSKIHRSNVNNANNDGVKAYTPENGLAGNIGNMTYDANDRSVKVCLYNLRTLMTEKIGTSNDKGIGRYPYVVTKIKVNEAGYYDIGTEINMKADGMSNTMVIMVDGVMHVVNATLGSEKKQTVWKNNLYLSEGEHTILYMSAIPENESDCPETADGSYYPWTNFWQFMVKKTSGEAVGSSVEYSDASTLTGSDVENLFKKFTRIEAEDDRYATWNIYNKTDNGGKTVGGVSAYKTTQQTFDELKNGGLDKAKTPYVEYVVETEAAGTYDIAIGAYVGTSSNADKTNSGNAAPYIAVLVNDKDPVKAQFGKWNKFNSVMVSVQLDAGLNTIRCTAPTKGQYAEDSSAWVNQDFIEVPQGLAVVRTGVTAVDSDWDNYLYVNRYALNGSQFGDPDNTAYGDLRYDFPSLYEDMLGIYSDLKPDRAGYWPYIALKVKAEEAGYYQIATKIGTNSNAKTIGMIVDGATYVVDVTTTSGYLAETIYLTEGAHVIVFTSPILRDMETRPATTGTSADYPWLDFYNFKLSAGLSFETAPTIADIKSSMTTYTRIETEDIYATAHGAYDTEVSKTYKRRYGTSTVNDIVKVKGAQGAAIDKEISTDEKKVNTAQTFEQIETSLNTDTSYVEYKVKADVAGTYILRVGAYIEGAGTLPYGTIVVNDTAYKAQFTGDWNGYEAVNIPVELVAGDNTIKCIGITADQLGTNGWIGYDFIDVPREFKFHEVGEYTETSVDKGLAFERRTTYETAGTISGEPYTISTWVYLPKGYLQPGGTIFGNYIDDETPCTNFEIDANGVPSFYHINDKGQKVSLKFNTVNVCADEWTNLTFTISGNSVSCYKNGILVGTETAENAINMEAVNNQYLLGGDLRPTTGEGSPNARYFKGRIIDVTLYDKALTEDEVQEVYTTGIIATEPFTRYKLENAEANKNIPDTKNNNPLTAKLPYFTNKEAVTDYAYSFAVVGDTQIVTENDVTKGEDNLSKIYDWILTNKTSKNIQFVFGLGDITDNNKTAEWSHAKTQISKLDGKIPYSLVRGNHDNALNMNLYLGTSAYRNQFANGGFYGLGLDISNSWRTLTVGEVDYLMMALDFGPSDDVLEWASGIIAAHPNHQVIITTHSYLYRDGTNIDKSCPPATNGGSNNGDVMWEKLISKHANIVLVLSGHDPSDNIIVSRDRGDNGNIVTSMLIDPQGVDSDTGSTGMLAMLYFSEDGSKIQVEYFSTVKGAYFKEVNQFTIELFNDEISASDASWADYLKLNMYKLNDNGLSFGVGNGADGYSNYSHLRYDYPSLYEDMLGIYSDAKPDRANWWPYIAFTVNAEKSGYYQIGAEVSTINSAKTLGMIVDGTTHVVDVTTKNGDLSETVYLTKGKHTIIFTSPMPSDMESRPSTTGDYKQYPYMDYKAFKLSDGLTFGAKPTDADIQKAMTGPTRVEAESISYVTTNGNYNANISKKYSMRYGKDPIQVKGILGAKIDGIVTADEKKVNTTQTFAEIGNVKLDKSKTSYVQFHVEADKAGEYMLSVGAYLEGKGTLPYATILVNGIAYKAEFSDKWNAYETVTIPVTLKAGENIIQCIGVTKDQTDAGVDGWIGYDFIDVSSGVGTEHREVSASDKNWKKYVYLNRYKDNGDLFGGPNYDDMRWDYPSLYADMVGIYSDAMKDRANYWPYVAFTVEADKDGEYLIAAKVATTKKAETIGMIVDGAMHVVEVDTKYGDIMKSVYLTKGKHVVIFTSPMPRDMEMAQKQNDEAYPWMDFYAFKLGMGLEFAKAPSKRDVQNSMTSYTRLEAEDIVYATYNKSYNTAVTKKYPVRYITHALTTIMGAPSAKIDGELALEEMVVNSYKSYEQLSEGLKDYAPSYVQYSVYAKEAGTYMIRIGAYVEGEGAMPYGIVMVNDTAYKTQFTGNWNGYDAVNLPVKLEKGNNTIRLIGMTKDQKDSDAWIGYDYLDIQQGLVANKTGVTVINAGDEKYVTFNYYKDKGKTLGDANYNDLRWDRLSLDMLNYAYLARMPYAAIEVTAEKDGTYDVWFKSEYKLDSPTKQIGVLVDGVTTYTMELSEFRSHVSIPLTAGKHTLVFTSPMPKDIETAANTAKLDNIYYPWMDMKTIILEQGLTVEKAPDKEHLENPFEKVEAENYAVPNLVRINENGVGSGVYLSAQKAADIVKNGIDPTVTPYTEYHIDASEAGKYTIYVSLFGGMSEAMKAEKMQCKFVIENGYERQVKTLYTLSDTGSVLRVIPVTLNLEEGINKVRITHFTGDSVRGAGYVWNDFDYIEMSPAAAEKLTFLSTTVLEAEEASFVSYSNNASESMSGGGYLGNADYGYIDENKITFEALNVEDLDDLPRVTYLFEAEKAGTYTLSVKFQTGLTNSEPEDWENIGFAVIVNGKDKQFVEYELPTAYMSTTRTVTVDLVEGENEITFTSTLAEHMNAVKPRIESEYRLVWVDHDALYLTDGLSLGKEAEKFGIKDSSVDHAQLDLSKTIEAVVNAAAAEKAIGIAIAVVSLAMVGTLATMVVKRKKTKTKDE